MHKFKFLIFIGFLLSVPSFAAPLDDLVKDIGNQYKIVPIENKMGCLIASAHQLSLLQEEKIRLTVNYHKALVLTKPPQGREETAEDRQEQQKAMDVFLKVDKKLKQLKAKIEKWQKVRNEIEQELGIAQIDSTVLAKKCWQFASEVYLPKQAGVSQSEILNPQLEQKGGEASESSVPAEAHSSKRHRASMSSSSDLSDEFKTDEFMSNGILSEYASLTHCPLPRRFPYKRGQEVTLGDLHGNSMKLIHFLIREGVIKLGYTQKECEKKYQILLSIYNEGADVQRQNLDLFSEILSQASINENSPKIRLLGDELVDRGNNDIFTIKILNRLQEDFDSKVPFEIIASNHGQWFVQLLEKGKVTIPQDDSHRPFYQSFLNMIDMLKQLQEADANLVEAEILNFAKNVYLPHLKLLSYSVDQKNQISFYSHAPAGIEIFTKKFTLNEKYPIQVPSECSEITDVKTLLVCIDELNRQFDSLKDNKNTLDASTGGTLIDYLSFNRYQDNMPTFLDKLPDRTVLNFVHGHDFGFSFKDQFRHNDFNLNIFLGYSQDHQEGDYWIYISTLAQ